MHLLRNQEWEVRWENNSTVYSFIFCLPWNDNNNTPFPRNDWWREELREMAHTLNIPSLLVSVSLHQGLKCGGFCSFPARRFHPQQVSTFQLMCADCLLCQHSEISNMLLTRAVLPPSLWHGSPTTGYLPFKANDNFHIITFLALEETHWFVDSYVSLNMNLEILLLPFRIYSLFYICERLVEFAKKMYKYRVATLRKKKM